ncbi:uncharacterized protein LOC134256825 isoform X1 [Saccostrea cucullata]|uniref:uncharacterized protein LOC134256825 isoform X1 n=1 Tax=Saccostrea cuccullata TaxID=36930 RepID=UPI002ED6932C
MSTMVIGLLLMFLSSSCLEANIENTGNGQLGSTHSNLNLLLPVPSGEQGHLEWLLKQQEGRQNEIEKVRASFIEGLLDEPLAGNGKEGSNPKSFLEELLSEPLFENELTKAVINSQKVPQKAIDIPVPPTLAPDASQTGIVDVVVDSLEIVKHSTGHVRERMKSQTNKVLGPEERLSKFTKGNELNTLQNIPKDSIGVDKAIGTLTSVNIINFKRERESNDLIQLIDKRKNVLKINQGPEIHLDNKAKKEVPNLPVPTLVPYTKEITHKEPATKKRFLHHLVYIFPSRMKTDTHSKRFSSSTPEKHGIDKQISYNFPRKMKNTATKFYAEKQQFKGKVLMKNKENGITIHNPSKVKTSETLKKFFLPKSQLENYVSSDKFRYGTLFPVYNYNVYKYRPWYYVSYAFDDQTMFPHFRTQHASQPSNHKQVNSY